MVNILIGGAIAAVMGALAGFSLKKTTGFPFRWRNRGIKIFRERDAA